MAAQPSIHRARLVRHQSPASSWELAFRAPAPSVRPYVRRDYCGYTEATPAPLRRRQYPFLGVVVIFDFGPPIRLLDSAETPRVACHARGFTAGLSDTFTDTEHDGLSRGLQLDLTPIGARLFFGLPMSQLANRIIGLDDLFDAEARRLTARLAETPDWDTRFDLLDRFIEARTAKTRAKTEIATWALDRIEARGGALDIAALAGELGYSQKHLIHQFHDHVGLPPKLVARIARFDRVLTHLKAGRGGTWAEIAAAYGYYDQAHLVRDFRQFTGGTPTETRGLLTNSSEASALFSE